MLHYTFNLPHAGQKNEFRRCSFRFTPSLTAMSSPSHRLKSLYSEITFPELSDMVVAATSPYTRANELINHRPRFDSLVIKSAWTRNG